MYEEFVADLISPLYIFSNFYDQSNCFLFESVTGGENKARYSIIGMRPDLVWESKMGGCKIAENLQESSRPRFRELNNNPLEELKDTIDRCKIDIPLELPPMIAGLFGYVSYDVIRQIENLPKTFKYL